MPLRSMYTHKPACLAATVSGIGVTCAMWSHWASSFGRSELPLWALYYRGVTMLECEDSSSSLLWSVKSTQGRTFLKLLYVPTRIYPVNMFPHIFPMSGAFSIFNAQLLDDHVEWNVNHVGYMLYWRMQNSAEYVVNTLFWVGMV